MDKPEREIEHVIHLLVSTPPSTQRKTIETYFLPNASFTHPFCRTGSFDGSRFLIRGIYRWYKIMSPRIDLTVHSVTYDRLNETLYVSISQVFRIFVIPFHAAPVSLVTVLKLHRDPFNGKYYIKSQEDLYQTTEFVKFVLPGLGPALVWLWQFVATFMCVLLAWVFSPISWAEEQFSHAGNGKKREPRAPANGVRDGMESAIERFRMLERADDDDNGSHRSHRNDGKDDASGMVTAAGLERR